MYLIIGINIRDNGSRWCAIHRSISLCFTCVTPPCTVVVGMVARQAIYGETARLQYIETVTRRRSGRDVVTTDCIIYIRGHGRSVSPGWRLSAASGIWTQIHNSLYHNLPNYQLNRLQQIQNSLAPAVVNAPKSSHVTPILKSLHWFKVSERIEYKLFSLTYKVLTTSQPSYLNNLISVQPPRSTRSLSIVTLFRPPTISSLKITDRSFR